MAVLANIKNNLVLEIFSTLLAILFLSSCGSVDYWISNQSIEFSSEFEKGFEIALLETDSVHPQKGYPINYEKKEIVVCLYKNHGLPTSTKFDDVDAYWEIQDSRDSIDGDFLFKRKGNGKKKISFYVKTVPYKYIKFPFGENEVKDTLPITFIPDQWYKASHFYPEYWEKNSCVLYFYLDKEGNTYNYYYCGDEYCLYFVK